MPRKTRPRGWGCSSRGCFNEAAARCRGKRQRVAEISAELAQASMRPRPDAAENSRTTTPAVAVVMLQ